LGTHLLPELRPQPLNTLTDFRSQAANVLPNVADVRSNLRILQFKMLDPEI
jgi:hypothetical protein